MGVHIHLFATGIAARENWMVCHGKSTEIFERFKFCFYFSNQSQ